MYVVLYTETLPASIANNPLVGRDTLRTVQTLSVNTDNCIDQDNIFLFIWIILVLIKTFILVETIQYKPFPLSITLVVYLQD